MPPKKDASKKKKKKQKGPPAPLVARPEPAAADELESAMMWDKVSPVGPNPLAPAMFPYVYQTASRAIEFGPPMTSRSVAPAATAAAFSPSPPQTTLLGGATGGGTARGVQRPRLDADARAATRFCRTEGAMLNGTTELHDAQELDRDLDAAMVHEKGTLQSEKAALAEERRSLEAVLAAQQDEHKRKVHDRNQHYNTMCKRLEEELSTLSTTRDRVTELLEEKEKVLSQTKQAEIQLASLMSQTINNIRQLASDLREEKRVLEQAMRSKLNDTIDEMQKIAETQGKARHQRSHVENARIMTELAELDSQSRLLNSQSAKLSSLIDEHRRSIVIENERREILLANNSTVSRDINEKVQALQALEAQFNQLGATADRSQANDQQQALPGLVDSQYEVVVQLKNDVDAIRQEIRDAELAIQQQRQRIVAPVSNSGDKPVPKEKSVLRNALLDAVTDVEKSLTTKTSGRNHSSGLESVTSARDLYDILCFVVRRVNQACFAPRATAHQTGSTRFVTRINVPEY